MKSSRINVGRGRAKGPGGLPFGPGRLALRSKVRNGFLRILAADGRSATALEVELFLEVPGLMWDDYWICRAHRHRT